MEFRFLLEEPQLRVQVIDRARVPIIMAALLGMLPCHGVTGPCVGNLKDP